MIAAGRADLASLVGTKCEHHRYCACVQQQMFPARAYMHPHELPKPARFQEGRTPVASTPPPLPFAAEDRCFTSPPTRTSRRRGNKRAGRNRPTGYATRVKLRARKCRMQITSKCVTCSTQHGAHIAYRTSNHKGRQKQVLFCNSDILSHTSARARMHTCLLA